MGYWPPDCVPLPLPRLPLLSPLAPAPPDWEPLLLPLVLPELPELDPLAPGLDDGALDEELASLPWLPLSPLPPPLQPASVAERKRAGTTAKYLFMW